MTVFQVSCLSAKARIRLFSKPTRGKHEKGQLGTTASYLLCIIFLTITCKYIEHKKHKTFVQSFIAVLETGVTTSYLKIRDSLLLIVADAP